MVGSHVLPPIDWRSLDGKGFLAAGSSINSGSQARDPKLKEDESTFGIACP